MSDFLGRHTPRLRPPRKLRSEGDDWLFAGDVKYHLGTSQADESFGSELRVSKLRSYQLFCEDMLADCSRCRFEFLQEVPFFAPAI